jgi:hypothetical protein
MFNIFEEISWPQFVKLNGINKMPLNEQVNAYNQYLYNLDVARQNWVDTQNKGPQLTSTPTPPILGDFLINTENVVEGSTTNDNQFQLPLTNNGIINFTIDWGDGSPTETVSLSVLDDNQFSYNYPTAGNYIVGVTCTEPLNIFTLFADQND